MEDRDTEHALTTVLAWLTDEDAVIADAALELYLSRFGDDGDARAAALRRLTRALVTRPAEPEARTHRAPRPEPEMRRIGPNSHNSRPGT